MDGHLSTASRVDAWAYFDPPSPVVRLLNNLHHEDKSGWMVFAQQDNVYVIGCEDQSGWTFGLIREQHTTIFARDRASDCRSYIAALKMREDRAPGLPPAARWGIYVILAVISILFFAALIWALTKLPRDHLSRTDQVMGRADQVLAMCIGPALNRPIATDRNMTAS